MFIVKIIHKRGWFKVSQRISFIQRADRSANYLSVPDIGKMAGGDTDKNACPHGNLILV